VGTSVSKHGSKDKLVLQDGHYVFLPLVKMVTLLYIMEADDTDGCYKLFPTQLQYLFTLLHILQHMIQALVVQCICLCSIILMTQNNSASYSVGNILEHLWGDMSKSKSHCLFKVGHQWVGSTAVQQSPLHFCRGNKTLWPPYTKYNDKRITN
jgi:hypothetical protein